MFGIGGGEILIIAVIAVVLFGTDDLPQNLRKFMKMWNDFRGATNDLQRGWFDVRDKVTRDILNEGTHAHPMIESGDDNAENSPTAGDGASSGAEGLMENTIADSSQPPSVPAPRRADGSVALGEEPPLSEAEHSGVEVNSGVEIAEQKVSPDSDKST